MTSMERGQAFLVDEVKRHAKRFGQKHSVEESPRK